MNPELEKQINQIQISCKRPVDEVLAGEYRSVFKGRGLDFDEVREYQFGDDVRLIDWNVTARTGKAHIKRFIEERELSVYFIVDFSASGLFTTVEHTKNKAAAELCALLAFSANKNNDKVGLIIFTDKVELYIPPGKGRSHILRIINQLLEFKPENTGTSIRAALDFFGGITKKHCVAFLISDFQDSNFTEEMAILAQQHDMVSVSLTDRLEKKLPDAGLVEFNGLESEGTIILDTSSERVRDDYYAKMEESRKELTNLFRDHQVDHIEIYTDQDYVQELIKFFRSRERRVADETGG